MGKFYCDGHEFNTAQDAMKYAFSTVYATEAEKQKVSELLNEGKNVSYCYGFSEITIFQQ